MKRKELDDFLKSLGKTYNLVLYRMQVTLLLPLPLLLLPLPPLLLLPLLQCSLLPLLTSAPPMFPQDTENLRHRQRERRRTEQRQ